MPESHSSSEFGIYVHWPFCAAKCPYCDFNSHVRARADESGWLLGIEKELEFVRAQQGNAAPEVQTVFFGGGTPSLMNGKSAAGVLDAISRLWRVAKDVEITLESNPASADAERFRDYRIAGINRLSLGVQALNDGDLKALGRLHDAAQARAALELATSVFDRVSIDLIYARPHQTREQWRAELTEALAFGTEHLSLYQLTIEPATPFASLAARGKLSVPGEELAAELYELTQELTETAGRPAYEISNHAGQGAECRHNLLYWRYGTYAGVGPGAHGRLDIGGRRFATSTERVPERWLDLVHRRGHGFVEWTPLSNSESAREHLVMSLRLAEGIDLNAFQSRWATRLEKDHLAALLEHELVAMRGSRLAATANGRLVLNSIVESLAA